MNDVDKYLKRRAKRMHARMDAGFEENDHPRDENGRFTSGGGGKKAPADKAPASKWPSEVKGYKVEQSKGDYAVCSDKNDPGLFYVFKRRDFKGKPSFGVWGIWEKTAKDGYRAVDDPRGKVTASSLEDLLNKESGR